MSEIKWIKLTTSMFDDEKIDFIESLPERDTVIVIWIKILTMAGKCNSGGYIYLTEKIPYTEDMLAHKFRRPITTVRMAIEILKRLDMIIEEDGILCVTNWDKHQNVDAMDRIKELNRNRKRDQRERERLNLITKRITDNQMSRDGHVTVTLDVTPCHATDIDIDIDKEKDYIKVVEVPEEEKEKKNKKPSLPSIAGPVIDYLNKKALTNYKANAKVNVSKIEARQNEGYELEDFYKVIDIKTKEWVGTQYEKFLRPETLFSGKFEGYLNQPEPDKDTVLKTENSNSKAYDPYANFKRVSQKGEDR